MTTEQGQSRVDLAELITASILNGSKGAMTLADDGLRSLLTSFFSCDPTIYVERSCDVGTATSSIDRYLFAECYRALMDASINTAEEYWKPKGYHKGVANTFHQEHGLSAITAPSNQEYVSYIPDWKGKVANPWATIEVFQILFTWSMALSITAPTNQECVSYIPGRSFGNVLKSLGRGLASEFACLVKSHARNTNQFI